MKLIIFFNSTCIILIAFFGLIVVGGSFFTAHAIEFEPYIKSGTINFVEDNVREGNKFLIGAGLKTLLGSHRLKGTFVTEGWTMGEPLDEDRELPSKGYNISGEVTYSWNVVDNLTLYPYTGLGFEFWDREPNKAYPGSWDSLKFFKWTLGAGIEEKIMYMKGGFIVPFASYADNDLDIDSLIGYEVESGIHLRGLNLGFFYKRVKFDDSSSNKIIQPNFKLNLYGGVIGYRF